MPQTPVTTPRRILALDGGGVRGIVTVAFLEEMESQLRKRSGNPALVLADHFDLIGGTSVGSILATMLALGWPMDKVRDMFLAWCPEIFRQPRWLGLVRTKFRARALNRRLRETLGDMRLDDKRLRTGYAIVTKRISTGSPWWILTNFPKSKWWDGAAGNRHLEVAQLIRASTAAPTLFRPKFMALGPNQPKSHFIDGALSPFNNPAMALLMVANLKGHGLEWELGADALTLISVGTGAWREPIAFDFMDRLIAARFAGQTMLGMIADTQLFSLALLQWMSDARQPWLINSEIGTLKGDILGIGRGPHSPLLRFQRYDLDLHAESVARLSGGPVPGQALLDSLRSLDNPAALQTLYQLAKKAAREQVDASDYA